MIPSPSRARHRFLLAVLCGVWVLFAEGKKAKHKAGAQGQACRYDCPDGIKPRPREGHKPTYNGCGVPGFMVESVHLTECCNAHDICFHTCQVGKLHKKGQQHCDQEFDKCMKGICNKLSGQDKQQCEQDRNMMNLGVQFAGCQFFQESQAEACSCELTAQEKELDKLSAQAKEELLVSFYEKHSPSKSQAQVKALLAKFQSRSAFLEMVRELEAKYSEHPASFLQRDGVSEL